MTLYQHQRASYRPRKAGRNPDNPFGMAAVLITVGACFVLIAAIGAN